MITYSFEFIRTDFSALAMRHHYNIPSRHTTTFQRLLGFSTSFFNLSYCIATKFYRLRKANHEQLEEWNSCWIPFLKCSYFSTAAGYRKFVLQLKIESLYTTIRGTLELRTSLVILKYQNSIKHLGWNVLQNQLTTESLLFKKVVIINQNLLVSNIIRKLIHEFIVWLVLWHSRQDDNFVFLKMIPSRQLH